MIVWAAGRVAVTLSAEIGWPAAALVNSSFLLLVVAVTAREIIAGRNWGNLKVLIPVTILGLGNAAFHIEAHVSGAADYGIRVGIAGILVLIIVIGGRLIPSFTRNWLTRENPGRLPVPFGQFDAAVIVLSSAALAFWIVEPFGKATSAGLFVAGLLQALRLARWAGDRTLRDRLVIVLHVAYAFVPLGFALTGLSAIGVVVPSAGLHAWMVGAAGMMTLAVMTRATLGHTGHELIASVPTQFIYAAVFIAAVAKSVQLLNLAGASWNSTSRRSPGLQHFLDSALSMAGCSGVLERLSGNFIRSPRRHCEHARWKFRPSVSAVLRLMNRPNLVALETDFPRFDLGQSVAR